MYRLLCAGLVLLGLGCGDNGGGGGDPTLESISIESVAPVPLGTTHELRATAHFSDDTQDDVTDEVTWESSDLAVLTITNGEARGVALGTVTVSATLDSVTGTTDVEVIDAVLVSLEVSPATATFSTAAPLQLEAVGTYSDESTRDLTEMVTWTSSDSSITISATGLASATTATTATITATDPTSTVSDTATLTAEVATTIELAFAGGASGSVRVEDATTLDTIAACTAACTVAVDDGTMVNLVASSPANFGGFSGACTTTSSTCSFTPEASMVTEVSVTFSLDPEADWERLLYPDETIFAADFDSAGNLIIGTTNHLAKLDATGATIWDQQRPVRQVRVGPSDTIYVISGTDLVKLDASGAEIWTSALGTVAAQPNNHQQFVQRMDVGANGTVAVHGDGALRTWASDGTPGFSVSAHSYNFWGVAIDSTGNIWSSREDPNNPEATAAQGYTAPGALLAQVFFIGQYHGMLAIDADDHLIAATSGHSDVWLDRRSTADVGVFTLDEVISDPDFVANGVAVAGDDLFWVYELEESDGASGFKARRVGPTGTIGSMFTRTPMTPDVGVKVFDVAGHTSGRRAVVGEYWTSPNAATLEKTGWIQTYAAPL